MILGHDKYAMNQKLKWWCSWHVCMVMITIGREPSCSIQWFAGGYCHPMIWLQDQIVLTSLPIQYSFSFFFEGEGFTDIPKSNCVFVNHGHINHTVTTFIATSHSITYCHHSWLSLVIVQDRGLHP